MITPAMRSLCVSFVAGAVALLATTMPAAAAAESASTNVAVTAQVSARTSLRVSAQTLLFTVADGADHAVASVDFSAGARTRIGGDVVLTVEAMRATEGPGGAADVESTLSFSGEGQGTTIGALPVNGAAVAARWSGSGLRTGRVTFALRCSTPGTYTVPLRFVLSVP